MKFLLNKFIIIFLIIILWLFLTQFYYISASYKRDTNSYVTLIAWAWKISSEWKIDLLKIEKKLLIKNWDTISTIWKDSIALIEWWDKSITRLSGDSKILVKENYVWEDLSKINISFELLKWKTWSNVVTILTWENHFKQEINWNVAAVRWTIFEANYEDAYIRVIDHEVNVTNSDWKSKTIVTWDIFSLVTFNIEKIKIKIDKAWDELNKKMDSKYLQDLQNEVIDKYSSSNPLKLLSVKIKSLFNDEYKAYDLVLNSSKEEINDYINWLKDEKKDLIINEFHKVIQNINFEKWTNQDLYNAKINSKEVLIENSNDENYKETLVKYTLFDLNSLLESNDINKIAISKTAELINNHEQIILDSKSYIENKIMNNDVIDKIKNLKDIQKFDSESLKTIKNDIDIVTNKLFNIN